MAKKTQKKGLRVLENAEILFELARLEEVKCDRGDLFLYLGSLQNFTSHPNQTNNICMSKLKIQFRCQSFQNSIRRLKPFLSYSSMKNLQRASTTELTVFVLLVLSRSRHDVKPLADLADSKNTMAERFYANVLCF